MQASNRMAEEAPSSSRLELLLLNFEVFPLLHCIIDGCFCNAAGDCWCKCSFFPFGFCCLLIASSTLETIVVPTSLIFLFFSSFSLLGFETQHGNPAAIRRSSLATPPRMTASVMQNKGLLPFTTEIGEKKMKKRKRSRPRPSFQLVSDDRDQGSGEETVALR